MSQDAQLTSFPIRVTIPVAWGDMDAYQHVNNTVYLRWFESARIAYFDAIGFRARPGHDGGTAGVGAILHSTQCRFRRPLAYPDTVVIGARVTDIGEDRFTMHYLVVSDAMQAVAAEGTGTIVSYDYGRARKAAIPAQVRERMVALEASTARNESA